MSNSTSESNTQPDSVDDSGNEELFAIIDETGEGFGFELTPEALMKPIAIGSLTLFGVGMLAGVPFGLAMGRVDDSGSKGAKAGKARPTMGGLKFAATTFGLGTLLCGAMGFAGFHGVKWYYDVNSFEEFGQVMKRVIPMRKNEMETGLKPMLDIVRSKAGESLPGPMRRMSDKFSNSRFGIWMREKVDESLIIDDNSNEASNPNQSE